MTVEVINSRPHAARWSAWLVYFSTIVLAVVVAKNAWQAWQYSQAIHAIRCDVPVFRFETAFSGDVVQHVFQVTNLSRRALQIERVKAECGCTTVSEDLNGKTVPSGGSFAVPVTLKIAQTDRGELEKKLILDFAGTPKRKLILKLTGSVVPRWEVAPSTVIFDDIPLDQPSTRSVQVTLNEKSPPVALIEANTSQYLTASIAPWNEGDGHEVNRKWNVTVTTVPPLPSTRRLAGTVIIQTSEGHGGAGLTVPVTVIVRDQNLSEVSQKPTMRNEKLP